MFLALTASASAQTFFQFTYLFDNGQTLVGSSAPGENAPGSSFAANQLSWIFDGSPATLLTGTLWASTQDPTAPAIGANTPWALPTAQSTFNVSGTAPFTFTRTGVSSNTSGGGIVAWEANGTFFSLANNTGALRSVVSLESDVFQVVLVEDFNVPLSSAHVALVPEINGSGFAYIAFILGALGLWLYSGAGRGRPEEPPAAV